MAAAFSSSCSPTSLGERRLAMIPEPMTATISKPVPSASATRRRPRSTGSIAGAGLGCPFEVGHAAPARSVMRRRSSSTVASKACAGAGRDGVGDRPVQPPRARIELFVGPVADGDRQRGVPGRRRRGAVGVASVEVEAGPSRRRQRRRDGRASAGWVPALAAATPVIERHRAAASWERAELAVHTNSAGCGRGRLWPGAAGPGRRRGGGRSGDGRHRSIGCARSGRRLRGRRGGGRAGSR